MPAQHRLRFDDEERFLPVLECACQQDQETTFSSRDTRPFGRSMEDNELLTKQQVFCEQLWFAACKVSDSTEGRTVSDRLGPLRDGRA